MAFITKEQLKNLFQVIEKVVGVGEFKCYFIGTFKAKTLNVECLQWSMRLATTASSQT